MKKAILALQLLVFAEQGSAFTLVYSNGVTADGWGSSTVTFDIDASCASAVSTVDRAIEQASETWGKVPTSSLQVKRGSTVTLPSPITTYVGGGASQVAPAGNSIVYCDTAFGTNSGADANSIPGFASAYNISGNGKIQGCLLVLNIQAGATANITTLNSSLVDVILTHEIGHCLGLGHSADPNALMYYATGAGRGTYLAQDDIDGITYLYPKQELGENFLGCGSVAMLNGRPPKGGSIWGYFRTFILELTLLAMFLIWVRRFQKVAEREAKPLCLAKSLGLLVSQVSAIAKTSFQ